MKTGIILFALGLSPLATAADLAAWTHRQTVRVTEQGLNRLELEPSFLDASRAAGGTPVHDLRLLSPAGVETAHIIGLPPLMAPERVDGVAFKATLHPASTQLEFQSPRPDTVKEVLLLTDARDFIKAANLEASKDGAHWETLGRGEVVCRQNQTERLRLPITPAAWTHFRITLDDARSAPVAFTGARLGRELPELPTVAHPVAIRSRTEETGRTKLLLDLGSSNVLLGSLRLRTPETVFQRGVTVLNSRATVFRLSHEGFAGEELEIPVHEIAGTREIELTILNGDSPPLRVERVEATRHAVPVLFQADSPGEWRLYIGNAQAPAPQYDIAPLTDKLRDASASNPIAGTVEANSEFRKTATAPDVGETGALVDVSAWSFRRPILFNEAGIVELELDPAVVARCESDLRDVRVVRDGQQIPFLAIKPDLQRETSVAFTEVPDPGTPTWSKWDILLPFPNFPATELLLESPTPLFRRTLTVTEPQDSPQGRSNRSLGSAQWQRQPGQMSGTFHLPLPVTPRAGTLRLATDNGDNPPLQITSMRLVHPVVQLLFRLPDTTPAHLCYGNRRATYARYDLQLVQREFENAAKVNATLGPEEKLRAVQPERRASGQGSPWLWAALALVVAALLWIVAKMLPQQEA